jgi:hypothetical protein
MDLRSVTENIRALLGPIRLLRERLDSSTSGSRVAPRRDPVGPVFTPPQVRHNSLSSSRPRGRSRSRHRSVPNRRTSSTVSTGAGLGSLPPGSFVPPAGDAPTLPRSSVCSRNGCDRLVQPSCITGYCDQHCTSRRCPLHSVGGSAARRCRTEGCGNQVQAECATGYCPRHCTSQRCSCARLVSCTASVGCGDSRSRVRSRSSRPRDHRADTRRDSDLASHVGASLGSVSDDGRSLLPVPLQEAADCLHVALPSGEGRASPPVRRER